MYSMAQRWSVNALLGMVLCLGCLIPKPASAACMVYWMGEMYTLWENSCNEFNRSQVAADGWGPCFTLGAYPIAPGDHVEVKGARAWLVSHGKRTQLSFLSKRIALPRAGRGAEADGKLVRELRKAFEQDKDAPVRKDDLVRFSQDTKLPLVTVDSRSVPIPQPRSRSQRRRLPNPTRDAVKHKS